MLLIPLLVWGAISRAGVLGSAVQGESREEVLFSQLVNAFSAEAGDEDAVQLSQSMSWPIPAILGRDIQEVDAVLSRIWRVRVGDDRSSPTARAIPGQLADYHVLVGRWISLLGSGSFAAARVLYSGPIESQRLSLSALIRAESLKQSKDVVQAGSDAFQGNLIGYGSAGLSVIALIVVMMLRRRRAERRESTKLISQAGRRYEQIVKAAQEGVWTTDEESETTFVNAAMARMLKLEPEDMIGTSMFDYLDSKNAKARERVIEQLRRGTSIRREGQLSTADGECIWVVFSSTPMRDEDGRYVGALTMVSDITARKRLESRLRHQADHDPLTGLLNRSRLIQELEHYLTGGSGLPSLGAVIAVDLDNFKITNDTYGHATGDMKLKAVAERLEDRLRSTDLCARLGGDEFAIVLPGATAEDAALVVRDVRALLCERPIGPPITSSFGIVAYVVEAKLTADEVLARADMALYEAKERGGDQASLYRGHATGVLKWAERIRRALEDDRFVLYGQPVVDLRSGEVTCHELLIRMLSDDGDIIPPAAFLPTAERFGLIRQIDQWVTEAGLRIASAGMAVSINLSASSIGEPAILDSIRRAVGEGLSPQNVMFEITETAAVTNLDAARAFAGKLDDLGCKLALDDFGTGFGSFTYLKYIPARYLKIDMEFVSHLATSETDQQIVKSIVGISHTLDKDTIAEGVEDAQTVAMLRAYGVHRAQGYYFGAPKRISAARAPAAVLSDE